MDDPAGSLDPGTQMILWNENNLKSQSWKLEEARDGEYKIQF